MASIQEMQAALGLAGLDVRMMLTSHALKRMQPTLQLDARMLTLYVVQVQKLQCNCLQFVPTPDAADAAHHLAVVMQLSFNCNVVEMLYRYKRLEGVYPTRDQLMEFAHNVAHLAVDAVDYCKRWARIRPTVNLDHLHPTPLGADTMDCSICRQDLDTDMEVLRLPNCGHVFHAHASECLGTECSILTWLRKNNRCPNCNTEVRISAAAPPLNRKRKADALAL